MNPDYSMSDDHDLLGTAEELRNVQGDRTSGWKRGIYPPKPPRTRVYDPAKHCGRATTTDGLPCTNTKGFHTPHPGEGLCKYHGGTAEGHIKHGLYAKIKSPSLLDALARVREANVDPTDLTPEVEALRAIVLDFIERRDDYVEALIDFKLSFSQGVTMAINADRTHDPMLMAQACSAIASAVNERPTEVVDISGASAIIDRVGKMSERIHKIKTSQTITLDQIKKLLDNMGMSLARHVNDAGVVAAIQAEWNALEL